MKKYIAIGLGIVLLIATGIVAQFYWNQGAAAMGGLQTELATIGDIKSKVEANGVLRAHQTALLPWQTSGTVEQVDVQLREQVATGQLLATLEQISLPQSIILAQADLINAQRQLEDLQQSRLQQAEAQKAVETAQKALEDALNPELVQAESLMAVTEAQKQVEEVQRNYEIISKPVPQSAIDQGYANMLVAEKVYNETQRQYNKIENKYNRPASTYMFWESKDLYRRLLEVLEQKLLRDRLAYERSQDKYESLLEPPDPEDVALAESALTLAKARLAQAQRDLERIQDGPSAAEIAVLEAQLVNAQREWERLKDGPDENDLAAAQARVTAAQAALRADQISAPFSGTITQVNIQADDQVETGDIAFRLDDLSRLLVDVQVSEIDVNKIKLGQEALLTFDSAPGNEYHGQVIEVPRAGNVVDGIANFKVAIELYDADQRIRPGMSSSVSVVIDEIKDALLVPSQALRFQDGQRAVYVLRGAEVVPIQVTLGITSESYSQVVEGALQAGDRIVLNPPGN